MAPTITYEMDPNKSKVDERKGLVLSPSGREMGCFNNENF